MSVICFARHCGYIKAKQDPEEEKMQFQHSRGEKQFDPGNTGSKTMSLL